MAAGAQVAPAGEVAAGRILIQTRAGLPDVALARILADHGGGQARRIGRTEMRIVDLPAGASAAALAERLARHLHIEFAELDRRLPPDLAVSDPYVGSQWHLPKIGTPAAWDTAQGAGVTIAILDSGVDPAHPDLASRLVPGWNWYENNANTADVYGHGTMVAGAAAAIGNNGVGVAGVAGQAAIMPIRVTDTAGWGYISAMAQGITWAADRGARVANLSFAGVAGSATLASAANYMKSKGGLVVVAAGNGGAFDATPATSSMVPVSATDGNDALAGFSSWGAYVAMAAPGVGIYTTTNGGGYGPVNGTSFASPVTAGVVALMMSARPSLPGSQIESLLYATATDLGSAGRDAQFGHGRVNASAAVQAAAAAVSTADTQAPVVAIASPGASATVSGTVAVDVSASDNVGVARVELRANGALVATDAAAPFAFSWNSAAVANGSATLVATAYDAAGNQKASSPVVVNVANPVVADVTAPVLEIVNPQNGSRVSGQVTVSLSASDNAGAAGIRQTLAIDGRVVATGTGGTLSYRWATNRIAAGLHTLQATARDAAGNTTTRTVTVTR